MPRKKETAIERFRNGKKPSQLWYTPEQYELVQAAAIADGRSMVNFAIRATLKAAQEVLKNEAGNEPG